LFLLYATTLFVNAGLLFLVEPMVAKMILPLLGGTPNVWNTSLFFFQALLLAGYAYAHFASSWLGTRRHIIVHLLIAISCVLALPVKINQHWLPAASRDPTLWVISILLGAVGFPFFILAAGAPLLQLWFAQSKQSSDPYVLYAASNLGSMVGLVAYPLVVEPHLSLAQQSQLWFYGYLIFLLLNFICAGWAFQRFIPLSHAGWGAVAGAENSDDVRSPADDLNFARRIRWVLLSFVPSSLLLGVTTYITTDIASAPLFWMVPLVLYLLSFVIAFARPAWAANPFLVRRQAFLLLGTAITVFTRANTPAWIILPLHLLSFFVTALICHGMLAQDRPRSEHLTEFYLWIAFGGVLGGLFNALLAPAIFKSVYEYSIAMIVAAFLRPYLRQAVRTPLNRWLDVLLPIGLGLLLLGMIKAFNVIPVLSPRMAYIVVFGLVGILCMSFAYRPVRFGLGMAAFMIAANYYAVSSGGLLYANRSFFGVYRAIEDKGKEAHVLFHGTTLHGLQKSAEKLRLQPSSYYHRTGPAGQVFSELEKAGGERDVAVVGLGTGALACYGEPRQKFTFYEIDPLVERVARDRKLFTYLRDCPPAIEVIIGDARISLAQEPRRSYNSIVLDAFSSDAIPVHLLTREAVELYLSNLAEDGLLLFHISNRYMDLAPVLARVAASLQLTALDQRDSRVTPSESDEGKSPSHWVIMARDKNVLAPFLTDSRWSLLDGKSKPDLWTDDYSNILQVIHWR
jgi:hypothetical protein